MAVLGRLTIDQIRTVFARISKPIDTSKGIDKDSLIDGLLTSGASLSKILQVAHLVESETPPRRIFITSFTGRLIKPKQQSFDSKSLGKVSFAYFENDEANGVNFKFEHKVKIQYWQTDPVNPRHKELIDEPTIHPVFVRIQFSRSLLLISYPGFEGHGTKRAQFLTYQTLVSEILRILSEYFGIQQKSIAVRRALDFLVENKSSRVFRSEVSPEYANGRLSVSTNKSGTDVESFFNSILAPYLNPDLIVQFQFALSSALKEGRVNSILALWPEEDLVSWIEFWDSGAEFYFIWGQTERSYSKCFRIFELLSDVPLAEQGSLSFIDLVLSENPGNVLMPGQIAANRSLSAEEIRSGLVSGVKLGLLKPVYRIRTSRPLVEHSNEWTLALSSLASEFQTIDGQVIDGRDLKNVEIGFLRSSNSAGVQ